MRIEPGTRLGPYEIAARIGAGGMGQVFRARDTRLGREVAIKVVPPELASDRSLVERLEREARAAAALDHPGICRLFDIGREAGAPFLVMELLDGESLRQRLGRGAMPVRKAVEFGSEVARALGAAHGAGIVHRDLKPENLFLGRDGRARILDFGLARPVAPPGGPSSGADTLPAPLTEAGTVLGTAGYMAPEQVRGEPADARSDIFALGAVLAESLTGRRAFPGDTFVEVGHAILSDEPLLSTDRGGGPPGPLRRILRRCLEKRPEDRFQSARDLAFALEAALGSREEEALAAPAGARAARRAVVAWALAGLVAGFTAAMLLTRLHGAPPPPRTTHLQIEPPAGTKFDFSLEEAVGFAVSPDGSRIAFAADDSDGVSRAWVRGFADREATPLPGTEGANSFLWSPDGRSLGFFTGHRLERYDFATQGVVTICETSPGAGYAGTWGAHGTIVMAAITEGVLYAVPAEGGSPRRLAPTGSAPGGTTCAWPCFLPDGERLMFYQHLPGAPDSLMLGRVGGPYAAAMPIASRCEAADPHTLLTVNQGTLVAQPISASGLRPAGAETPVAPEVGYFISSGGAYFSVSPAGVLAYQQAFERSHLAWIDAHGDELSRVGAEADYLGDMSLSRDGRRLLTSRRRAGTGTFAIWSLDLRSGIETRLTSDPVTEISGRWLPDGHSYVYATTVLGGRPRLATRDLVSGRTTPPATEGGFQDAQDVSPDGRWLLYTEHKPPAPFRLFARRLPDGRPVAITTGASSDYGRFSPDGRAVSMIETDGDRPELYVAPFPGPGEPVRVSSTDALLASWSPDGGELDYVSQDGHVMAVPVTTAPRLRAGRPRLLFRIAGHSWKGFLAAAGGRFLAVVPDVVETEAPLDVIVGWRPPR